MKKVMIVVAIACSAVLANAASCNWSTFAYDSSMSTALEGGTYWIVSLGASDAGISSLQVKSDGTTDFGSYTQIATGTIPSGTYGQISGTITGLSAINNNSYYAIVVWDGESDGFYGVASGKVEGIVDAPPTDATTITFDNSGLGYGATLANTAVVPVPEPTSGILMLVGLAGLALRRRRA